LIEFGTKPLDAKLEAERISKERGLKLLSSQDDMAIKAYMSIS